MQCGRLASATKFAALLQKQRVASCACALLDLSLRDNPVELHCNVRSVHVSKGNFGIFQSIANLIGKSTDKNKDNPINPNPLTSEDKVKGMGRFARTLEKLKIIDSSKYRLMIYAATKYEEAIDNLDYNAFFTEFNMEDTLFSWFLITELHVWMLMVRGVADGKDGKIFRDTLLRIMWEDVEARIKKLGTINSSLRREGLKELSAQFNAAIIGYDEGIMSNDKVLAGALWRRFFCLKCNNPEHVEKLLLYVRKQVSILDRMPSRDFFLGSGMNWIDIKTIK